MDHFALLLRRQSMSNRGLVYSEVLLYNSGAKRRWTYDSAGQVVSLIEEDGSGGLITRFTFVYDPVGNRTDVRRQDGQVVKYTYDAKNRLTEDHTTGADAHTYTYSYDSNDNRLTSSEKGTVSASTYDAANRLVTSVAGTSTTTYTYDSDGNLTNITEPDGTLTTMVYDQEDRLIRHESGSTITTYTYDGDGLKRTEQTGSAITTLLWDGSDYVQARS